MKESLNELEKCLIASKNPVLKYLDSGTPFDQKAFENALDSFQLEPHEDLISLYNWKHGIKKELVNSCDFRCQVFELGDPIDYTLAMYVSRRDRHRPVSHKTNENRVKKFRLSEPAG